MSAERHALLFSHLKRIRLRKGNVEKEDASGVRRALRTHDRRNPLEDVVALGPRRAVARRVHRNVRQLLLDPARRTRSKHEHKETRKNGCRSLSPRHVRRWRRSATTTTGTTVVAIDTNSLRFFSAVPFRRAVALLSASRCLLARPRPRYGVCQPRASPSNRTLRKKAC